MIATYAIMAVIATILLIGYCALVRKKEPWLLLLYICVTVVNVGYFLLSVAKNVSFAIVANDIVYLGSVFLSVSMLLTIVKLCGFETKKELVITLIAIGTVMFTLVATSGILPWYYKEVSLVFVGGAAKLDKVYGVLHPTYLFYLLAYFSAMVVCIIQSVRKKKIASQKYASLLAAIVFGNIAVWFVEKFIPWDFEFLAVSYLFSEIILLGLYWMMQDYVRADLVPTPKQGVPRITPIDIATMPIEEKIPKILSFLAPGETLGAREREILELVLKIRREKRLQRSFVCQKTPLKHISVHFIARLVSVRARNCSRC